MVLITTAISVSCIFVVSFFHVLEQISEWDVHSQGLNSPFYILYELLRLII